MVPIRCGERRNGIGSVLSGRMVFMRIPGKKPPLRPGACSWSQSGSGKFKALRESSKPGEPKTGQDQGHVGRNETAALPRKGQAAAVEIEQDPDNQLLRRPSAARFHCDTLSAIMRVDFIAAWLSWA